MHAHSGIINTNNFSYTLLYVNFRHFTEAVLEIHNCINVSIIGTQFFNNTGHGMIHESFRGNTGCLSISYHSMDVTLTDATVYVHNCEFVNNTAYVNVNFATPESILTRRVYTGRGGAVGLFVSENNFTVTTVMTDCHFLYNQADAYGGAVYIVHRGYAPHEATIGNTMFSKNGVKFGGGGLILVGLGESESPRVFLVVKCTFDSNMANIAGSGLYYFVDLKGSMATRLHINDSAFVNNVINDEDAGYGVAIATIVSDTFSLSASDYFEINTLANW